MKKLLYEVRTMLNGDCYSDYFFDEEKAKNRAQSEAERSKISTKRDWVEIVVIQVDTEYSDAEQFVADLANDITEDATSYDACFGFMDTAIQDIITIL